MDFFDLSFKQLVDIPCFGPSTKASLMEGTKTFAKDSYEVVVI